MGDTPLVTLSLSITVPVMISFFGISMVLKRLHNVDSKLFLPFEYSNVLIKSNPVEVNTKTLNTHKNVVSHQVTTTITIYATSTYGSNQLLYLWSWKQHTLSQISMPHFLNVPNNKDILTHKCDEFPSLYTLISGCTSITQGSQFFFSICSAGLAI